MHIVLYDKYMVKFLEACDFSTIKDYIARILHIRSLEKEMKMELTKEDFKDISKNDYYNLLE